MRAIVVVDLGFGDAGKGLVTDFFVRATGAGLVVRYNGGAQAGHNVVAPDGRHHTFAQIGSGAFVPGVRTLLSRHVAVHPAALLVEAAALEAKGVPAPLRRVGISEEARVITPFHQAAGRLREIARGAARHGSCGVGVGETVRDSLQHPEETIRASDLRDPARLRVRAARARDRLRAEMAALDASPGGGAGAAGEWAAFEEERVLESWIAQAAGAAPCVVSDAVWRAWAAEAGTVVFEGAQGVLLDEWAGLHPFTSWSRCTTDNAQELIGAFLPGAETERVGVMRAHAVRHGPGPLPTETDAFRAAVTDHNVSGPWQGPVRYGWFDAVLARHALDAAGGVDRLVLTHVDAPARAADWSTCDAYDLDLAEGDRALVGEGAPGLVRRVTVGPAGDLEGQEKRTRLFLRARPRLDACARDAEAVVRRVEDLLGRAVDLIAQGPRAYDVTARGAYRPASS